MENEMRLIDANALLVEVVKAQALEPNTAVAKIIMLVTEAESVDAVPVEKYNALKKRYEIMKEIADILDTALRQYQRQYGE